MKTINTDDLAQRNARAGHHWFSPGTLRFFRSRISATAYMSADEQRAYFVSSEQHAGDRRRYSVRVADLTTGHVGTEGEFQAYGTWKSADGAARSAALWKAAA
jgi:hypothetical protein